VGLPFVIDDKYRTLKNLARGNTGVEGDWNAQHAFAAFK
jgi:hypothetical protein